MTRNTKLYKVTHKNQEIIYRDLTVAELGVLDKIKADTSKFEFAAHLALVKPTDTNGIPFGVLIQIGRNAYINSYKIKDKNVFELTVEELRKGFDADSDSPMPLIEEIIKAMPGQSATDLMNLTFKDLIELVCLAERIRGIQILNAGKVQKQRQKGAKLVDTSELPDDGKSLQQKMAELNAALGQK